MKITIHTDNQLTDTEVVINCRKRTSETEQILTALRLLDRKIVVYKGEIAYILDVSEIFYIESVDRKTFVYTSDACYETKLRLTLENGEQLIVSRQYADSLKIRLGVK